MTRKIAATAVSIAAFYALYEFIQRQITLVENRWTAHDVLIGLVSRPVGSSRNAMTQYTDALKANRGDFEAFLKDIQWDDFPTPITLAH